MKKYLIALDLDGTSLSDWQTMNKEIKEIVTVLKNDGHKIVIATGRPFRSSEQFYDYLELDTPMINYNGGLVTNKHDDNFEKYSINLNLDHVLQLFEDNKEFIHNAFGEIQDDIFLLRDEEEIRPLLHYFNGAKLFIGDFKDILKTDPNGFMIVAKKGYEDVIEKYVKEVMGQHILSRNWGAEYSNIIEIFTPQTNKGTALDYVAKNLGFTSEDIIAIGDGHNDIEMIEYAKLGVAMKDSHPELIEKADMVLDYTSKENGVEKFLRTFFNK
ncbi:hypothetical protein CI105_00260 [Candidatus Izimaplasma bacterium ZiA1]|uniref:HAD family hydrolase n=1 Tax=Candidatus Izimoplasma sp. ZiA1 TaxID=2024899 RepID=UPI000BAA6B80|nr:hypothetical protein CI105_00260 [Candidatus Izimaplasma bacterium ZiA1]